MNWSWLVVFALIVWTWATGVFPETNPGYSDSTYVAISVVAAILFFGSLLAHELGHALQARREGMEIEGITLWLFGGVAKFKGEFPSAGAEFRIAVAGPLVSLALGVAFVLIAWLGGLPEVADAVCAWLGYINLTLLVFNLLPALPLDGGRIFRAALWALRRISCGRRAWRHGSDAASATSSSRAALRCSSFRDLQRRLARLPGWFLLIAATAEDRTMLSRQALHGLRVGDLAVRNPVTAHPGPDDRAVHGRHRLEDAPHDVSGHRQRSCPGTAPLPVRRRSAPERMGAADGARLHGAGRPGAGRFGDEDLADAAAELAENDLHRALVVDGDRFVGLLSASDVARALQIRRAGGGFPLEVRGGRRDSNPRLPGPQPGALPTELRPPRKDKCSPGGSLTSRARL